MTVKSFNIPKQLVLEAYRRVRTGGKSPGEDGQTLADFEEDLKGNLYRLWNRLSSGSYFPPPVKRVEIPKGSGGVRILGIPTFTDRIAQMVVKLALEPLIEPRFHPDSYGYRPGKSALEAVGQARHRCWKYGWVVDLDIKGFFDNLDHDLLLKAVNHHKSIPWHRLYIKRWLEAPVIAKGQLDAYMQESPRMSDIEAKQKTEIEFWRDSEHESPNADSIYNIVNKVSDSGVFLECLNRHQEDLITNGRVLELGGGQGWASCVYKKLFPNAHVTATDISEFAVMSLPKWERIFEVRIDNSYACKSYEINEIDASLDQIFCFASAHHFLAHKRTLCEISRVLKPGGKAFYFHEPATPNWLYSPAYWRVNRKRPQVPEDVLKTAKLRTLAWEVGLDFRVDYYPSLTKRGAFETVYFFILGRIPFLQRLLPCSANFILTKKSG